MQNFVEIFSSVHKTTVRLLDLKAALGPESKLDEPATTNTLQPILSMKLRGDENEYGSFRSVRHLHI